MNGSMRCGVAELQGKDFVARVRLSDRRDTTLAVEGQTCERVPASSLAGLLADGAIAPVEPKAFAPDAVQDVDGSGDL
jgi:hypothetical protein